MPTLRRILFAWMAGIFAAGHLSGAVSTEALAGRIEEARGYLIRHCDADGRFHYIRSPDNPDHDPGGYNMLRHAGAVYALGQAQAYNPSEETLAVMRRAVRFLRERALRAVPERPELLAVWADLDRSPNGTEREILYAKLGGAGLGLVAMASLRLYDPDAVSLEEMRGLGRFLFFMQQENGHFFSYYLANYGRSDHRRSLYYPGEAMIGLAMLYEADGDAAWLEAALRGMGRLAGERAGDPDPPADHWALLATARLLAHFDKVTNPPVGREVLLAHAKQICRKILSQQVIAGAAVGAFHEKGRTCPSAIRLEGLAAMFPYLDNDSRPTRAEVGAACGEGAGFLLHAQISGGPLAGGFPERTLDVSGGEGGQVRVDYVQHALSALLGVHAVRRFPDR